jgi:hypothetical protein
LLQARKIRAEVETKLPDGALCLVDLNGSSGATQTERRAYELLQVIAQRLRTIGTMITPGSCPVQDVRSALEVSRTTATVGLKRIQTTQNSDASILLFQQLEVSCVSDDDPELAGMMKRLLCQDFAETGKPHAMEVEAAQSPVDLFNSGSSNVVTQGKNESDELRKRSTSGCQSEAGGSASSLSSDSDTSESESTSSSNDDSSTLSSSSESEESQKH